jgi:hypothetical protein
MIAGTGNGCRVLVYKDSGLMLLPTKAAFEVARIRDAVCNPQAPAIFLAGALIPALIANRVRPIIAHG